MKASVEVLQMRVRLRVAFLHYMHVHAKACIDLADNFLLTANQNITRQE